MHGIIFYTYYLLFPLLLLLFFLLHKNRKKRFKNLLSTIFIISSSIISLLFIYSRFIERNVIVIKTTEIDVGFSGRFAVISDLHLGIYKNADFLQRVVDKTNRIEKVDALLIPGDFTYYPPEDLEDLFYPLRDVRIPVYAVLGNHDSGKPGPPIRAALQKVLENNNVIFLHNTSIVVEHRNITILGLGDRWADEDDISKISNFSKQDNVIVLTHNPDTALRYRNSIPDLSIAGHTHGGQIRIPFVYKQVIPCVYDFDQGLYTLLPAPAAGNPAPAPAPAPAAGNPAPVPAPAPAAVNPAPAPAPAAGNPAPVPAPAPAAVNPAPAPAPAPAAGNPAPAPAPAAVNPAPAPAAVNPAPAPAPAPAAVNPAKNVIFTREHYGKVFVTAGIGEVGLPMRFGIPPTIDILELK